MTTTSCIIGIYHCIACFSYRTVYIIVYNTQTTGKVVPGVYFAVCRFGTDACFAA